MKGSVEQDVHGQVLEDFARDPLLRSVRRIVVSGGEPTLSPFFVENLSILHRNLPDAYFVFTVNGLNPKQTVAQFEALRRAAPTIEIRSVGISLNGPPAQHDEMRGVKGAFDRSMETFDGLSKLVPTAFSFTLYAGNVHQLEWAQRFAEEKGADVYICWLVRNDRFCTRDSTLTFDQSDIVNRLQAFLDRHTYRTYDLGASSRLASRVVSTCRAYQYDHVLNQQVMPCFAGRQFIHLAPTGDVYPCNFLLAKERCLGNIQGQSLSQILSRVTPKMAREIDEGSCMFREGLCGDSDIFYSIMNSLPRVALWKVARRFHKRRPTAAFSADGGASRAPKHG